MKIGDKFLVFTDIHYGMRNNERRHNDECERFIKWAIEQGQEFGAETSIFCGDWHHQRSSIQVSTLNYSYSGFRLLSEGFKQHFQIVGNHDLFYKDKREINSVEICKEYKNIHLVNEFTKFDDVLMVPWLVGAEHKKVIKQTHPYIFGHFEFPHFQMNATVEMPDVGKINANDFSTPDQWVFSGHFHKRQIRKNASGVNIGYIGNCFPHNFSDAWDDARGIMLLELGKEPQFKAWPGAPKFRTTTLSALLDQAEDIVDEHTNCKVTIDLDISYDEANYIKESFQQNFGVREITFVPRRLQVDSSLELDDIEFETVDQIVMEQIKNIQSTSLSNQLLLDIYSDL